CHAESNSIPLIAELSNGGNMKSTNRKRRFMPLGGIIPVLLLSGLLAPRNTLAIASKAGRFEYAIDAPWRIEPRKPVGCSICLNRYVIPVQISIHDMNMQISDTPRTILYDPIANLLKVTVQETVNGYMSPAKEYMINDLHEVERTNKQWPYPEKELKW